MKRFKIGNVRRCIRRFSDFGADLNSADFNTFEDRLSKFCHFCETDEVFASIHMQLHQKAIKGFESWWNDRLATVKSMSGSGKLIFPTDDDMRIAYMYEVIWRIHDGAVSFTEVVHNFFAIGSTRYDDYIAAINDAITAPMIRDLGYKLEEVEEDLEDAQDDDHMVLESAIQIIHHADNVIQQNASGTNISQKAILNANSIQELKTLFEQLRSHSECSSEDVDAINAAEEEATRPNPRRGVVKTLLNGLSFCSSAGSIIASILNILAN